MLLRLSILLFLCVVLTRSIYAQKIVLKNGKMSAVLKRGDLVIPFFKKDSIYDDVNWKSICKKKNVFKPLFYQIDSINPTYFKAIKYYYSYDTIPESKITDAILDSYFNNGGDEVGNFKLDNKIYIIFSKLDSLKSININYSDLYSLTFSTIRNYKLRNYYLDNGGLILLGLIGTTGFFSTASQSNLSKITYGLGAVSSFTLAFLISKNNRIVHHELDKWKLNIK